MDGDFGFEDLVYIIEQFSNGWVVLWVVLGIEVCSFMQVQLDDGFVLFLYRGILDGGFYFGFFDGEYIFFGYFF